MSGIKMKDNFPKITVVTITYNAEKFLEDTILSIINQDYPNIEYIIIDGDSKDSTIDIIKKYEKHISCWISEPDNGIYDAMNKGIDKATGEWINFMNAGDSFVDNTIISKIFNTNKNQYDLIYGDHIYIKQNSKEYTKAPGLKQIYNTMPCCHQSLFSKVKIAKELKFNTYLNIASDYDFILRAYKKNYSFLYTNFAIANYLENGISEQNVFFTHLEQIYVISKYIKDPTDVLSTDVFNSLFFNYIDKNNFTYVFTKLTKDIDDLFDKHKNINLYGFGTIGKFIYNKYKDSISAIVDKEYKRLSLKDDVEIFDIDFLKTNDNPILISALGREDIIAEYLTTNLGISNDRILILNNIHNNLKKSEESLEHYQQKTLDFIYKHIKNDQLKILEVGGIPTKKDSIAKRLAKKDYLVTQIDLWSNIVEEKYDGIHFMKMDANNTIFKDSSFDVIFGSAVLEHISNLDIFLKEMYRILDKNGIVVLHGSPIWNSHCGHHVYVHIDDAKYEFCNFNPIPDWGHLLYSPKEMKTILLSKGIPEKHIEAICNMVYDSNLLNRLTYDDIMELMKKTDFKILEISTARWTKPTKELIEKNSLISDYGEIYVVLKK
ncbi:glycosyltransferase [Aliarcobacter skirrowii]|uniref:glycosyltransferase n=1 Tax=Aliarcobacter skirrowii TaxID=28200 RepID=UPI0029B5BA9F|nr:glycosyltransferase [Aliarcobacter skirrowii]MDX4067252.1 glycosyltransferase [Aliarcobacter skirrowii]MDX4067292.1 glycosyltransferase [Aliarcobacter skirrowii]